MPMMEMRLGALARSSRPLPPSLVGQTSEVGIRNTVPTGSHSLIAHIANSFIQSIIVWPATQARSARDISVNKPIC